MIAIPVSGEAVRRTVRTAAVAVVTVVALGLSLPNLLELMNPLRLGDFDFYTSANVVIYAGPRAKAAGISAGDQILYSRMPPNDRYGDSSDGLREPPVGKTIAFVLDRHGTTHVARLAAQAGDWGTDWSATTILLQLSAQKSVFLVAALLASALLLIRPTRLSAAFFLFAAGNGVAPVMYSVLPIPAYTAVMVADDVLAGLGAIGFLAVAFYLDPKRQLGPRRFLGIAALLFALIVVPLATSDAVELLAGVRPAWPIAGWTSFVALWTCYVAGFVFLMRATVGGSRRIMLSGVEVRRDAAPSRGLRILAAVLVAVGALTILDWTISAQSNTWYFANLPGIAMNRGVLIDRHNLFAIWLYGNTPFLLRQLGSLIAFYLLVRAGVGNAGPVYRSIVAYVIVALLVVAGFSLANIALIPRVASYAAIIPFEILAAIAIGYWVSGLRDLASCLSLACVDAWRAWANGRSQDERDVLAQSLGLAQRTRRQSIIAEVRAQIAFSSWRNGEDGAFEQKVDALRQVLRGRNMRGIRAFADAATSSDCDARFHAGDLPEWRARASLVLCARTGDAARAQQLAMDALASADQAGLPSLRILASIAVAETCADRREALLARAHAVATDAGWPALSKSILALRAHARDIGLLQTFVDVRLRKSRPASSMFYVSFFNAELRVNGTRVPLVEKQLELLLTVASAPAGINDNDLLDALWPESDGDAARNSLRVCLHGLRKSAGDARIVTRVGKGFVLHQWADVDLWRFQSLLAACRESGGREGAEALRELCRESRAGEGRRATLGDWFFRFEQLLERKLDEADRLITPDAKRAIT
ncbi:MAG: hypothetical protein JO104_09785 [Candidatus Eremiobacteraeota bacterium]|nr:hypothetical protein [Candidatus Eremiobacteraeota bacterium]